MLKKLVNYHQHFSRNEIGTDYFVGDVHGHYDLLMISLKEAGFSPDKGDRVFSLGDLINRGNNSSACLDLLLKPWFFAVIGNHEDMLLSLRTNPAVMNSLVEVGGNWLLEYIDQPSKLQFFMAIIYAKMFLAFTVETHLGNIGLTHAEAPDDWLSITKETLNTQEQYNLFWSFEKYNRPDSLSTTIKNIDVTLHGHTNSENIVIKQNQLWIDTLRCTKKITVLTAEQIFKYVGGHND